MSVREQGGAGLDPDRLIALRPRLLHVTTPGNARLIADEGLLRPAGETLALSGRRAMATQRRASPLMVRMTGADGTSNDVYIRDQAPLKAGNMRLEGGWTLERFVEELNAHVYFWPSGGEGAGAYARRLFNRYAGQGQVVMSFDARRLIDANRAALRVCACNSGAPRCNPVSGKALRGPGTLAPIEQFTLPAGRVQEVAFRGSVRLAGSLVKTTPVEQWLG